MPAKEIGEPIRPDKQAIEQARRARQEGKSPSTQAGEFVRDEIHHIRNGKHGARSAKQVIAIGLSKARRAGVRLKPPAKERTSEAYWRAQSNFRKGQLGLHISFSKTIPGYVTGAAI